MRLSAKKLSILKCAIENCDLQSSRLQMALRHIAHLLPLQAKKLTHLTDEEIGFLDLLTSRFSKLQDGMGQKIFPLILELLEEDITGKSFLDCLNRLETLGILNQVDDWIILRKVRNAIAHDYPDNLDLIANNLNAVVKHSAVLLEYWANIKLFIEARTGRNTE